MRIMRSVFTRSIVVAFLCQSLIFSPLLRAAELAFPSGDLVAPEIHHEPIIEKVDVGKSQEIRAVVTDNVGVNEVILFYRSIGSKSFLRMRMINEMGTDEYFAVPPNVPEPGIEYYIQATDFEGNTLLRGHSFSPLTVKVKGAVPVVAEKPRLLEQKSEDDSKGVSKWVWIGLGVLALGAAAGGGGDDGGGDPAPPPASSGGTIIITGPAP